MQRGQQNAIAGFWYASARVDSVRFTNIVPLLAPHIAQFDVKRPSCIRRFPVCEGKKNYRIASLRTPEAIRNPGVMERFRSLALALALSRPAGHPLPVGEGGSEIVLLRAFLSIVTFSRWDRVGFHVTALLLQILTASSPLK
jgi:hypothetical protein